MLDGPQLGPGAQITGPALIEEPFTVVVIPPGAAAVLDETLLLYLAQCTDVRLPDFLTTTLPYASLNPYMPSMAGNVPKEIYFGRDDQAVPAGHGDELGRG